MTTEEKAKPATDLFDQAIKGYEQALKTGVKMQEESAKFLSNLLSQGTNPQDWQKRMKAMTDEFIPQTQKSVEDGLKFIDQSSRTSIDLLKKAVAAGQPASMQDAQAKLLGLWEASLNAIRDTALSVTQAHNKAVESWVACARKNCEPTSVGAKA